MQAAQFRSEAVDASTNLIEVSGEVDLSNASQLEQEIARAARDGAPALIVDLTEVTHLDSTGLGKLVNARRLAMAGAKVVLVVAPGPLRRLFEIRGIEGLFEIRESREAAIAAIRGTE